VARLLFIKIAGLKQRFEVTVKNRKRRPQFVRDIGNEIAPDLIDLFES
jgi:hypothetical protein